MPRLTAAHIPHELEPLLALGVSRSRIAILIALARLGGEAGTGALVNATGILRSTLLTALKELEESSYVEGSVPAANRRRGTPLSWRLQSDVLRADLAELARACEESVPARTVPQ